MSKSAGGSRQTQNAQTGVNQPTQEQLTAIWNAANASGQSGPSPLASGASDYFSQLMNRGNLGMGALSGDPNAVQQLMDPYQKQVIDANNAGWQRTNQQTANQVNSAATQAGAFGGTRAAVAQGAALSGNNIAQQQQTAGLLSSGYNNAINQAGTLAGYGYNAAGANANLGMGGVGSPQQWLLQQLKSGFIMPSGTTSSGAQAGVQTQGGFKIPGLS